MSPAHDSVAIALPFSERRRKRLEQSARKLEAEIQIGVGPCPLIPARVLGFCSCAVEAINLVELMLGRSVRLRLFSSAPKIAMLSGTFPDPRLFVPALAALSMGFRSCGFSRPIYADIALAEREVADQFMRFPIPESINAFLKQASDSNANGADPLSYAAEHASASMYGDLRDDLQERECLRVTIGGNPEARFWPIRQSVVQLAENAGRSVSMSFAVIMRTLKRPWYSVTPTEPLLTDLISRGPEETALALDRCANPGCGGNPGLRREARHAARNLQKPHAFVLAEVVSSVNSAAKAIMHSDISVGKRLSEALMKLG